MLYTHPGAYDVVQTEGSICCTRTLVLVIFLFCLFWFTGDFDNLHYNTLFAA